MGGDGLQAGGVQRRADFVRGQGRHAAPLHIFPAHLASLLQRICQVLFCRLAQGVQLQRHRPLFRRRRGEPRMKGKCQQAHCTQGFPARILSRLRIHKVISKFHVTAIFAEAAQKSRLRCRRLDLRIFLIPPPARTG